MTAASTTSLRRDRRESLWERGENAVVRLFQRIESLLVDRYLAVYGAATLRILISIAGVGLLLTNFIARDYLFGPASAWNGEFADPASGIARLWIFSSAHALAPSPALFTIYYLVVVALGITVMLGWHTRWILPFYLVGWVSIIELNPLVGDQGDNAYRIVLIAMLFMNTTLRWSLDARRKRKKGIDPDEPRHGGWAWKAAHNLALLAAGFQVCIIYFTGGLYKAGGDLWANGTAVYYPLQTAQLGIWPVLSDLLTAWAPIVVAITWGTVIFQVAFPFLLFNRYGRRIALIGILVFHLGIALFMGLPWFSLAMIAVDSVFVSDTTYRRLADGARALNARILTPSRARSLTRNRKRS